MFRGVMDLQLVGQALRFGWRKDLVERGRAVGIQVIHHEYDSLRRRVAHVHQVLDLLRPVDLRPLVRHRHPPLPVQGLAEQKQVDDALSFILIIHTLDVAGGGWQGRTRVAQQLLAHLVHADLRIARVVGSRIDVEDILHPPDELGIGLRWDAPVPLQPRLKLVVLSTRRMVWYETSSTISSSTSLSARSRSDQRAKPSGGVLQATAIKRASCAPSSFRWYRRRGARRLRAASSPSSTNCLRTRATVGWLTSTASAIASSTHPGPSGPWSALSRIRACVSVRAGAVPAAVNCFRYLRSVVVRVTGYFLRMPGRIPSC